MNVSKITSPNFINKARKGITKLANPSSLLPVVLLETTVTGGRSYQAYKRNGIVEFRERFTEEVLAAIFWLGGATALNKFGDRIGEKFLKLPKDFDGGFDALRTPLKNTAKSLIEKTGEAVTPDKLKSMEKKLAGFKFSKILLSTLISTAFVGFALPKINHEITKRMINKDKFKEKEAPKTQTQNFFKVSIDDFHNKVSNKSDSQTFGANPAQLANLAHNLENHAIYKLLSTDTGILAGRTATARNNDERVEIIFRDATSSYFYTINPIVVNKVLKKTVPNGKLAEINSDTSQTVLSELSRVLKENGGKIPADKFKSVVLGTIDESKKAIIDSLPFNNDVISLDALKSAIKDSSIIEKAEQMSGLQPVHAELGKVLTRKQVEDVFANGAITDFASMFKMHKAEFGDNLTRLEKFVPMKKVNQFRDAITTFVDETVKCAKNGEITEEVLKTVDKKNLIRTGGFWLAGFATSALFLSTIIPKTQYLITRLRTGKNEFPGLHDESNK